MAVLLLLPTAAVLDDPNVRIAVITTIGVVFTGLLTFLATRYSAQKSAKVSVEANKVTERQVDVSEWKELLEQVKGEATRLDQRVQDLETKDEAKRLRIETLEGTVRELEHSAAQALIKYSAAMQYIRDIMAWAVSFITNENKPPSPPPSIANDLID